jgi:carbon-monoxide dehydrogenase medium subunit
MSVPRVTVLRPRSVEELGALLGEYGDEARVYAGATELVVAMKLGLTEAPLLIDLKGIAELADVMVDDDRVRIGATTTHRYLERDPEVAAALPVFARAERHVANARVRAIGTLGGNLAFGEPHSDPATFLVAAEADYALTSAAGVERRVPAAEFLRGPFEPDVADDEILTEVTVPRRPGRVFGYQRFKLIERPAANVAVRLDVDAGVVKAAAVVVGSATSLPTEVQVAGDMLTGMPRVPETKALADVGEATAAAIEYERDADPDYLRPLVATLTTRAVREAFAYAAGLPERVTAPRRRWGREPVSGTPRLRLPGRLDWLRR